MKRIFDFKDYIRIKRGDGNSDVGSDSLLLIFGPFIAAFLIAFSVFGQTFPTPINLDDVPLEIYEQPNELPDYLVPFENEFGLMVTRISDETVFGVNNARLGHNYSSDQPWNSDQTFIKLAGYPAALLDAETKQFIRWINIPGYGRWFNNNPHLIYGVRQNRFEVFDIRDDSTTILRTFEQFNSIDLGYGEGNADLNDRFVCLIGDNVTLFVYDMQNDVVVSSMDRPNGDLDKFYVSPLGNYVILDWRQNGSGPTQGMKRYDLDFSNMVHLNDYTAHSDCGLLENNDEVVVSYGNEQDWNSQHYINMTNLTTGEVISRFYWPSNSHGGFSGIWGGHVSMRSNRKGVAYISEECCNMHPTLPSKLFALHLDGSNNIERFATHHSNRDLDNDGDINDDAGAFYNHSARLVPNRDGTQILFVSNYHDFETQQLNSGHAYIVEMPQQTLSAPNLTASKKIIFPNPSSDKIKTNFDFDSVECSDVTGKHVYVTAWNRTVYLKNINPGPYILRFSENGKILTFKIVKR